MSWLAAQGYDWTCVHRGKRPLPPEREPDSTLTTQAGHAVWVWQLQQKKQETLLYAVSEARKHKEEQILQRRRTLLEAALTSLHDGLQKPYRTKRYQKVVEQVGRIKERYARVSHQYKVTVVEGSGPHAKAVTFARKPQWEEADGALGGYVLRTSQTGWDLKHIVATYWRLSEVGGHLPLVEVGTGDAAAIPQQGRTHRSAHQYSRICLSRGAPDPDTLEDAGHPHQLEAASPAAERLAPGDDDPQGHPRPGDGQRAGRAPKGRAGSDSADLRRHAQPASAALRATGLRRATDRRKVVPTRREYTLFVYVES